MVRIELHAYDTLYKYEKYMHISIINDLEDTSIEAFPGMIMPIETPITIFLLAGFRPNSEIIGKFRKLKKFYGHFVKRQK